MNKDDWDEYDDEGDEDGCQGEDDETIPCPYCKRMIHEESPRCPHCGNYLSEEDSPARRKPWWIILGTILVLYIVYRWIVG